MKQVEGLSQREIHRRTGIHRDTIRKALASPEPPSYGPRAPRVSKLDPFVATIEELLRDEPTLSGVRVREERPLLGIAGAPAGGFCSRFRSHRCRRFRQFG